MIALSPVSNSLPVPANGRRASPSTDGGFAHALAALTGGDDDDAASTPSHRQDAADDGKTLPDPPADPAAPPTLDPRLLWLPSGVLPTLPMATPAPVPVAVAGVALQSDPLPPPAGHVAASGAEAFDAPDVLATGDKTLETKLTDLFKAAERMPQAVPPGLAAPALFQPQPAQMPVSAAVSANLATLGIDQTARDDRKTRDDPALPATMMTTEVALRNAVQPTGDTRHVPLDLRGDTGLQKMIDHIETLRDDADARDTRIRLVPDALGGVDVAVRRTGDAIHVHFTADTEATRALLTKAEPRLVELADARGVRIAGASVDTNTGGGGGGGQQPRAKPTAITTNLSISTPTEATGDDARLA